MEIIHISKNRKLKALRQASANIENINNNNNIQQVDSIKKCLFGVPDLGDIENMLEEQKSIDWERIKDRFGLDLEDIENMENIQQHATTPSKKRRGKFERKNASSAARRRRLFNPYERKITDFYQERKNVQNEKKD